MATTDVADKKVTITLRTLTISVISIVTTVITASGAYYAVKKPAAELKEYVRVLEDSLSLRRQRDNNAVGIKFIMNDYRFEKIEDKQNTQGLVINKALDIQSDMQKLMNEKFYNKK